MSNRRRCPYCHKLFTPSAFCPRQRVCASDECQRRRQQEYHRKQVHAVLVLDPGVNPDDVIRQANERLQTHQRVQGYTVWPEKDLPKTATGKARKGVVREAVLNLRKGASPKDVITSAGTDVRSLVSRMAQVDAGSLKDETRFAEQLGLGSLDLVELAAAIEEEFGVESPGGALRHSDHRRTRTIS